MDLAELLSRVDIRELYVDLGGTLDKNGNRGRAFWRDGQDFNVTFDTAKGTWFDHVAGKGGGVLDLIVLVLRCSRSEAVSWLYRREGIPEPSRPWTAREKAEYARKRSGAEALAVEVDYWLRGYCDELERRKWNAYDRCDDAELEETSRELFVLQTLDRRQLVKKYLCQRFHSPERTKERVEYGKDDAAHAEACTNAATEIVHSGMMLRLLQLMAILRFLAESKR